MGRSNEDLHIAIVGAGMGGLATALALAIQGFTHIDVYEAASNLGFVGAGIQLAPNLARILDRLGCWTGIEKEAVNLEAIKGNTDQELAHVDLHDIRDTYGHPHMVGHRSSLAGALFSSCQLQNTISFFFSTTVEHVNCTLPRPSFIARPRNSQPYPVDADVLIAADGIKSSIRAQILAQNGVEERIQDTGQSAYRIMIRDEDMTDDPDLLDLVSGNQATRWIGEKKHITAYPVSSKTIYNISTVQPDAHFAAAPSATYTTNGSKSDMLATFSDFCPKIQRLLSLVPEGEVCEWKLRMHGPLPTWVHGSVALVGDACHPTLPHMAQGAAQAIEDAAVLAVVLSYLPDQEPKTINRVLRVYETLRKTRAETLVELAAASGRALHLGEGAAKAERDKQFALTREEGRGEVPDRWADAEVQKMVYGHDCMQVAQESFDGLFART